MAYEQLDDEELLQLALSAMREANDAAALEVLKALVARRPEDGRAQYLLGAQYAQLNMADRAESALRKAVELAPDFPLARLQLGQLLLVTGQLDAAKDALEPMGDHDPVVQAYAQGLCALAEGQESRAVALIRAGLAMPQSIEALAEDMRRLVASIAGEAAYPALEEVGLASPMLLSNYSRHN